MPDEAARTRRSASNTAQLVSAARPEPGDRAELFAFDRALAQLSEAALGMVGACRSCHSAGPAGHGDRLSLADVPAAAADLLGRGASIVHAVTGWPDLLGLLTAGPLLRALAESGAQARILCQDVLRTDLCGQRALRELARSGAQVATIPALPPPVIIVDRQAAFVAGTDDVDGVAGATLVQDPGVAGYLAAAVDSFWAIATPVHDAVVRGDDGLSPADRALLRLLADGMTQQDAARRLHLSLRTVSRRTVELKRELRAASPLQAGLEAARRGWL